MEINSNIDLDDLHSALSHGLEFLHQQSEIGDGGRARILFHALAGFLDERGIIDHLKSAANYMAEHASVQAE